MAGPQGKAPIDPSQLEPDEPDLDPAQVQNKELQKPVYQRYFGGAWDTLNPVGMLESLTTQNPATNWGAAVNAGMDMYYSHPAIAARAMDAAKRVGQGELSAIPETAALGVASAIPLQGPAMVHAADRIASGDVAGGLGETTGILAPFALSHAGPAMSKTGRVIKAIGKKASKIPVGTAGSFGPISLHTPVAGLLEAAYMQNPTHAAFAAAPYGAQAAGWGMEKAGNSLTGLRNATTRMSERFQTALGLDPLAERLGFTRQTPVDTAALEAAHRARTPAPRPGRTAREKASSVRPDIPAETVEKYGGQSPTTTYDPANPQFGEPALPIETLTSPDVIEPYGGQGASNYDPANPTFGEPALPLTPTPLAETATGVPADAPILRKAGDTTPSGTATSLSPTQVASTALDRLRQAANSVEAVEAPPAQTITPASKSEFGYDSGQPAANVETFTMGENSRPRSYTPPDQPLPQNAWSPEIGLSPELPPTPVQPTTPKPRPGSVSFEGVDWNQQQPAKPTTSDLIKLDLPETMPESPRTIEGHPFSRYTPEGDPPLSPSLQKLADAAAPEPTSLGPETNPDAVDLPETPGMGDDAFAKWSDDVDELSTGFLDTDEGVRQPESRWTKAQQQALVDRPFPQGHDTPMRDAAGNRVNDPYTRPASVASLKEAANAESAPTTITPNDVLDAIYELNPQSEGGALVRVDDLRNRFDRSHPGATGFDEAMQQLMEEKSLQAQSHAWPGRLTDLDKGRLMPNGRGGWFDAVGLRLE